MIFVIYKIPRIHGKLTIAN